MNELSVQKVKLKKGFVVVKDQKSYSLAALPEQG